MGVACKHPEDKQRRGGDISLRYGSAQTRVCTICGGWRMVDHHGKPHPTWKWRIDPLNLAMREVEDE